MFVWYGKNGENPWNFKAGLDKIDGIQIHTPDNHAAFHILNFSIPGIKSEVFIHFWKWKKYMYRPLVACLIYKKKSPSKTLLAMGVPRSSADSAIRISLSYENTEEEATTVVDAVKRVSKQLRKVMN